MSILAIESVQAHLEDLQREASQRRRAVVARRAAVDGKEGGPSARARGHFHVRRVLGARS